MKQIISVVTFSAILFTACTGSTKKTDEQTAANMDMQHAEEGHMNENGEAMHQHDQEMGDAMGHDMDSSMVMVQESNSTALVLDAYLKIKNALVEDDDKAAARAGKDLVNAFDNIDESSVSSEKMSEMKDIIADARENADHISESKGDIEHQREHFDMLSTDVNDMISIAGADRSLYRIFCPMYNNSEGAYWLSESKDIKNPFFGSKMSDCGEVRSKIVIE